jgi:hypothetical protein
VNSHVSYSSQPLASGEKRVKEEWENVYVWGMTIAFAIGIFGYIYQPNEAKCVLELVASTTYSHSTDHVYGKEAKARIAAKKAE